MNTESDYLINGIASSINGLILNKDLNVALYNTLRNLGESLKTDACFIYVNELKRGSKVALLKYSWTAFSTHFQPASEKPVPHSSMTQKIRMLKKNKIFEAKSLNASKFTRTQNDQSEEISLISFPIFVHEEFWGFLEVRDSNYDRDWGNSEKNILQIVITSIGGAIERNNLEETLEQKVIERTRELNKNKTYLNLAIEAFDLGMWIYDVDREVIRFNMRQAEIYELKEIGEQDENGFYQLSDVQVFIKKWSPDHTDLPKQAYADIIAGKRPYLIERKLLTDTEGDRYVMSKGVVFSDDEGTKLIGLTVDLTERKLEELELRRSNTKYALATKTMAMGIWDWNLKDDTLEWDEGMFKLYDIEPEKFHGTIDDWKEFLCEEDEEYVLNEVQFAMEGTKDLDIQFRIKDKSGNIRHIRSCANIYKNEEGENIRMVGLNLDITDHKETELALRASEEKFKELYNQTPAMLHSIDATGKLISVSDYWLEHLGYKREDVLGTKSIDYLTDESKKNALATTLPKFFKEGYAYNSPHEFKKSNGEVIYALLSAISRRNETGNFTHSLAVITDITERVKTEKALRSSHEKFESLIQNIPGIVYTADYPSFNMVFATEYCKVITGYSQDQLHNAEDNLYISLIHQDDIEDRNKVIQECLEQNKSFRVQYRLVGESGKVKWVSEYGHAIYDEKGEVIEIEGLVFDITDKVKSEEKILSAIMETADRERSRISAEIHDSLQQTLTIASLNFEYAWKDKKNFTKKTQEKYLTGRAYLKEALNQTRSIAHGLMPKAIEDVGFIEVIHDMTSELNGTTNTKFSFLTNVRGFCFTIMMEATLYKIVQEAVNNIIKHAKAKHVTIQFLKHKDRAHLSIEDDGVGFELGEIDMSSSGFGIASMKNRVAALHGFFQIDSKPKGGVSIFIEIPTE